MRNSVFLSDVTVLFQVITIREIHLPVSFSSVPLS